MKEFFDSPLFLLFHREECIEAGSNIPDKSGVNPKADFNTREFEGHFGEYRKCCDDEDGCLDCGKKTDIVAHFSWENVWSTCQRTESDKEDEDIQSKDCGADECGEKTKAAIRDSVTTKPLAADPGKENPNQSRERPHDENALFKVQKVENMSNPCKHQAQA